MTSSVITLHYSGYNDVAVADPLYNGQCGRVYVVFGGTTMPVPSASPTVQPSRSSPTSQPTSKPSTKGNKRRAAAEKGLRRKKSAHGTDTAPEGTGSGTGDDFFEADDFQSADDFWADDNNFQDDDASDDQFLPEAGIAMGHLSANGQGFSIIGNEPTSLFGYAMR